MNGGKRSYRLEFNDNRFLYHEVHLKRGLDGLSAINNWYRSLGLNA